MTNQQMQYAYWQRMRQQQIYRAYAAGAGSESKQEYAGLCFTAEEAGSTVKLQNVNGEYQISTNGNNWTNYKLGDTITLANVGDKVYFAAKTKNNTCWNGIDRDPKERFIMSGKIAASGNIQSLLDKTCEETEIKEDCCYKYLFYNCAQLTKSPMLPATSIAFGCYASVFSGCTSLTIAPELPATVLYDRCYEYMFSDCSSLTAAPELPAKNLAEFCYDTMFQNCSSLSVVPTLSSETLCAYCYANMFKGCSNLSVSENGQIGSVILDTTNMTTESLTSDNIQNMFAGTAVFTDDPTKGNVYRCYQ